MKEEDKIKNIYKEILETQDANFCVLKLLSFQLK